MSSRFTVTSLKKLAPRDKPYEVRAPDLKGLLLRVQPSGVKTFYYEHSRGKREKLGKNGNLMLESQTITQIKREAMRVASEGPKESRLNRQKATLGGFALGDYSVHIADKVITHRQHIRSIERNFEKLFDRRMDEIQPLDIERWKKRRLSQGVKFETIKRDFASLKACLNTAVSPFRYIATHELVSYRLEAPTETLESPTQSVRYLSREEEASLRKALIDRDRRNLNSQIAKDNSYNKTPLTVCFSDHVTPLVLLALNTGLRRGDLFHLEWRDIDLDRGEINKVIRKTRRKNKKTVCLPLSNESVGILKRWKGQVDSELVFPSPVTGRALDNIDAAWKEILKRAEIARFRFHDLRHTFATRLVEAGVPIYTVKELMTHSSIAQTEIYAHVSADLKKEAINTTFNK